MSYPTTFLLKLHNRAYLNKNQQKRTIALFDELFIPAFIMLRGCGFVSSKMLIGQSEGYVFSNLMIELEA